MGYPGLDGEDGLNGRDGRPGATGKESIPLHSRDRGPKIEKSWNQVLVMLSARSENEFLT